MQLVYQLDQQLLFPAPNWIAAVTMNRRVPLLLGEPHAIPKERNMHAPLIRALAPRAGPVDHDLPMPQRHRPTIDQSTGAKLLIHARHPRQRSKQTQRRNPRRHDLIEHRLQLQRIRRLHRLNPRNNIGLRRWHGSIVRRMVFVNSCPRSSTSRDGGYFYSNEGNEPMHIHAVKERSPLLNQSATKPNSACGSPKAPGAKPSEVRCEFGPSNHSCKLTSSRSSRK